MAAGILALHGMAWSQVSPRLPSKIVSVTAKLYYSDSGTFSANILDKPDLSLWNTIIGEGAAGGPSEATLIEVEVDGDRKRNGDRLSITVQQKGKAAITRHAAVYFKENGKYFAAIWLYDSGCSPVTITAQLGDQPVIRKTIDFQCGE
ncbi:MAG TPA: hypothetical protein VGJ21_25905 [Terracidiphilus sp.]